MEKSCNAKGFANPQSSIKKAGSSNDDLTSLSVVACFNRLAALILRRAPLSMYVESPIYFALCTARASGRKVTLV